MTKTKTYRQAKTRRGKVVDIDRQVRVNGGWISYVIDRHGYAVHVFVPDGDSDAAA